MVLDAARSLLEDGPICDACLGRVFANRSHGLANAERGFALRVSCALADDEPYEPPAACWVCDGRSAEVEEWATWAVNELTGVDFETYQVGTRVPPLLEENDRLLREDAGLDPEAGEPFNRELNREVGKLVGDRLGVTVDFDRPDVVVVIDLPTDDLEVQLNPAFVYGRYRKLVRGIPQTEWPCRECHGSGRVDDEACEHCGGAGRLYDESVEGFVAPPVRAAMDGTEATFHGAGREDVDARMLGTGRPFVVEVAEPKWRFPSVGGLEAEINARGDDRVEVEGLALATHEMVERVKELPASKTYRADIAFDAPVPDAAVAAAIEALDGVTVEQRTPHRVAHRRADRVRERTVYRIEGDRTDDRHATVEVHAEGGLYIKELLGGDEGRTEPNLADLLGVGVVVEALDVLAVEAEEGCFADPAFLREPAADGDGGAGG